MRCGSISGFDVDLDGSLVLLSNNAKILLGSDGDFVALDVLVEESEVGGTVNESGFDVVVDVCDGGLVFLEEVDF